MNKAREQKTETTPVFLARGLTKTYNGSGRNIEVLKGVDLQLTRGEMIAIVGVSGTGKSTLLHILGTLDRPTTGELTYDGVDIFAKNDTELSHYRNQTIGFVFQSHHLLPEFTALENVMMPGLIRGCERRQLAAEAHDLLARVELDHRTGHKVGELSGGEQQRVALARAVIMQPALLLADEPTGNLDTKTGHKIFELLRQMSNDLSLTAAMVTHNMDLANEMDRCLTMADGRLHG